MLVFQSSKSIEKIFFRNQCLFLNKKKLYTMSNHFYFLIL